MAIQVTNYQCPACTGPLHFSGETGMLECDYCGSSYDVAEIEALYAQKDEKAAEAKQKADEKAERAAADGDDWDTSGMSSDWGDEANGIKAYTCPSCGAELLCEETTAATSCPYCGNPTVVPGQFSGMLKPDYNQRAQAALPQKAAAPLDLLQGKPSSGDKGRVRPLLDV